MSEIDSIDAILVVCMDTQLEKSECPQSPRNRATQH